MSDQTETIAAILADYRADIPAMTSGELPHPTPEYLRILLDRIEAAYKREHADWHAETDAAKDDRNRVACRMRREFAAKCRNCKERSDTIYAGRDGEMTLDECIVRCDNNSGDDPRGRDVAQIGGWLRELRERMRAPGNAAALREALNSIADIAKDAFGGPERHREASQGRALSLIIDAARDAIAAPARNADRFADPGEAWLTYKAECEKDETVPNMIGAISWLLATAEGGAK